jgi:hypothetical protein
MEILMKTYHPLFTGASRIFSLIAIETTVVEARAEPGSSLASESVGRNSRSKSRGAP